METHRISSTIRIFYDFVMPAIAIMTILIAPMFIQRHLLLGAPGLDFIIRLLLCLWFYLGYTRLHDLKKKYRLYPNIIWSKADVSPAEKVYLISMTVFISIGVGIVTWFVFNHILPLPQKYIFIPVATNTLIFLIPLCLQYEALKL